MKRRSSAFLTGLVAEGRGDRRAKTTLVAMLLGNLAIYALGLPWLACFTGAGCTPTWLPRRALVRVSSVSPQFAHRSDGLRFLSGDPNPSDEPPGIIADSSDVFHYHFHPASPSEVKILAQASPDAVLVKVCQGQRSRVRL